MACQLPLAEANGSEYNINRALAQNKWTKVLIIRAYILLAKANGN